MSEQRTIDKFILDGYGNLQIHLDNGDIYQLPKVFSIEDGMLRWTDENIKGTLHHAVKIPAEKAQAYRRWQEDNGLVIS